ncbi:MAG: class I SAM-dependent methyltransferase family protein [Planctomycetaceae bacterium]
MLLPAAWLRRTLSRSQSPLIRESFARPGGWRSMELVYENADPVDWPDRQALRWNPVSIASRNRRRYLVAALERLIRHYARERRVTIVGVGAGPGRHVQEALLRSEVVPELVDAWLVDRDDDAFPYGRELAQNWGLSRSLHFIKGDARCLDHLLPDVRPQIVKLVGLIEYLSDSDLSRLLEALRDGMEPEGTLVTHGLIDRHDTGPFLRRVFGLAHVERDADHLGALLANAGFRPIEWFVEPLGIFPIVTATLAE